MEQIEKKIRYSKLMSIYGSLLSYSQREIGSDYFIYDLSISEIAESRNVSRSAVEDAISKASKKLDEFEDKMHVLKRNENIMKITSKLKQKALNCSEIDEISAIEEELDYGIWSTWWETSKNL